MRNQLVNRFLAAAFVLGSFGTAARPQDLNADLVKAAESGDTEMVRALLKKGANVNAAVKGNEER